jgi:hypothetical protein
MSRKEQVEQLTNYMANFVAHIGKVLRGQRHRPRNKMGGSSRGLSLPHLLCGQRPI